MMKPPKEKQKEVEPLNEDLAIAMLQKEEVPSFAKYKGVANTMIEHSMFKKSDNSLQWQIDDLCMKLEYCRSMGYPDQFANNVYPADGKFEEDFKILSYCVGKYAPDAEFIPIKSTNEECVIKCRRNKYGQPTDWQYVKYTLEDAKRNGLLNKKGVHWVGEGIQNMLNKDCYAKAMRLIARAECRGGHINEELPSVPLTDPEIVGVDNDDEPEPVEKKIDEMKTYIPSTAVVKPEPEIINFEIKNEPIKIEKIEIAKPAPVVETKPVAPIIEPKKNDVFDFEFADTAPQKPVTEPIKKEEAPVLATSGIVSKETIAKIEKTPDAIEKIMGAEINKQVITSNTIPHIEDQVTQTEHESEVKKEPSVDWTEKGIIFKDLPKRNMGMMTLDELPKDEITDEEYSLTDTCGKCGKQKDNICGATNNCKECDELAAVVNKQHDEIVAKLSGEPKELSIVDHSDKVSIVDIVEKKPRKKKTTTKKDTVEKNASTEQTKPFPIKEMAKLEDDINTIENYAKIGEDWFASISIEEFKQGEIEDYNIVAFKDAITTLFPDNEALGQINMKVIEWCANTSSLSEKLAVFWHDAIMQSGLDIVKIDNWYMRTMLKAITGLEAIAAVSKGIGTIDAESCPKFIMNASDGKWDIKQARWGYKYIKARGLI